MKNSTQSGCCPSGQHWIPLCDETRPIHFSEAFRQAKPLTHPLGKWARPFILMLVGVFSLTTALGQATVTTDKDDYTPGQIVTVTGSGWLPGETVSLLFEEDPATCAPFTTSSVADASGNFTNTDKLIELHDLGVKFFLTATGQTSGMVAEAVFTDAPPAANLDQVRNGAAASPVDPGNWVNGNLGAQQSHYAEGMSVAYRAILTDMPPATVVNLTLEYDVQHSQKLALDYLTSYDRLEPHQLTFGHTSEEIDPTIGIAGFMEPEDDTEPIPVPGVSNSPVAGQPAASFNNVSNGGQAYMSMWNGDITNISYTGGSPDLSQAANQSQQIVVTFTTSGSPGDDARTVILAWGGHIASRIDWGYVNGDPRSAGGISGSPYHMRLIDWNLNNLGNQDRSLQADAVVPPPDCTLDGPDELCEGEEGVYTVTPIGAINPTYTWALENNTSGATIAANGTTATVTAGTAGEYTVKVTINSEFGTTVCDVTTVVNPNPACSITGPEDVCPESTGLVYTGPAGMDSYSWTISGNGTIVGSSTGQSVTVDAGSTCGVDFVLSLDISNNGCTNSCDKTVSVDDNTPPVITCPSDVTLECTASTDPGDIGIATATDNCDNDVTIDYSDQTAPGSCPQESVITRTWTATDDCGNSSSCVQIITIVDTTPPVITCTDDVTIECDESSDPANTGTATATDNCDNDVTIDYSDQTAPGSCPQESVITRTWTATDDCGNSSSCVQIITIVDTTPPVITCADDVTIECDESSDPANTGTATATDNCDNDVTIDYSDQTAPGSCPQESVITRTWTATDDCGNSSSCVQIITIVDTTPPVITCADDVTIECDESSDPANTGTATATDNCDNDVTIDYSDQTAPGSCPQESVITRTWTATDDCGNSSSCVQIITIVDTTPPVITCADDVTIECDESSDPANTGTATATDNCDNDVTIDYSDQTAPGSCPQESVITRTWTATDDCGNSSSCVQIITIVDTTPPVITCADDVTIECDESSDPANTGTATATDNCDNDVTIDYSDQTAPGSCPQESVITRTWTATDDCGNSSSCVQIITIVDTTAPEIACPDDVTFECTLGDAGLATAIDNCDGQLAPTFSDVDGRDECGLGTITRTWTATDDCGNSSSCVQIITIVDTTAPEITCPDDVTFECTLGDAGLATAIDNCDGLLTPTFSDVDGRDECGLGTITRTWTAEDCAGNTSSCIQIITIVDTTAPEITCPDDVTFECTLGDAGLATAFDNCDGQLTPTFSDVDGRDACGLGTITRTWTAEDCAGNTSTCIQIITIVDTTAPEITCPDDVTFECTLGDAGLATAFDNCDGQLTPTFSDVDGRDACGLGTITRTWTAEDCAGNTSTCTQIITIKDDTPPVITCPDDVTFECTLGDAGLATAIDNCDPSPTITSTDNTDGLDDCGTGVILRTWKAEDCNGNVSECIQVITINDPVPTITVPADVTVQQCGDPTSPSFTGIGSATGGCGEVSISFQDDDSGLDVCGNGVIKRLWKAVDGCGNSAAATQIITIDDCGNFELLKTTDGVVDPTRDWSFTLTFGDGDITETTFGDANGVLFEGLAPLSASETYTICETNIPAGWSTIWRIDADGDGVAEMIVPAYNPDMPQDLGVRCFDFGAGTAYPLPSDAAISCTLVMAVDNSFPGGDPRTPGYWKNWSTCSGGNQVETAAKNGGCDEGYCTLDDILNSPGIVWCAGTEDELVIDECEQAVNILDSRDNTTGRKRASDAAYNLARALLAAQLNFSAGAETCSDATAAAIAGEDLLCSIGFDGTGKYLRPKDQEYAQALELAGILDSYNNGELCNNAQARTASPMIEIVAPETGVMLNAYPNPFVSTATIDFSVPQAGQVRLEVYNLTGVLVERLFDGEAEAGVVYHNTFDATGKAKGIYLYRLITADKVHIGRLMTTD